jgi:hypothetical protein
MSRACTICDRPFTSAVDVSLAEGRSARKVAAAYGLSYAAVLRHGRNHATNRRPAELVAALRLRAAISTAIREYREAAAATVARVADATGPAEPTERPTGAA